MSLGEIVRYEVYTTVVTATTRRHVDVEPAITDDSWLIAPVAVDMIGPVTDDCPPPPEMEPTDMEPPPPPPGD
jgi:hypothetical protein